MIYGAMYNNDFYTFKENPTVFSMYMVSEIIRLDNVWLKKDGENIKVFDTENIECITDNNKHYYPEYFI